VHFSRITRMFRDLTTPGTGRRRKGHAVRIPPKPTTPPPVPPTVPTPDVLDMAQVADALMMGIARHGLGIFGADTPALRPTPVRVTATLPASAQEFHPLARASKRLVRPEDAHLVSPAHVPADRSAGVRVRVGPPIPAQRRPVAALSVPPRPIAPPPVRKALSAAHSGAATSAAVDPLGDTAALHRDPGWDALFSADTLSMPLPDVPEVRSAHLCRRCDVMRDGTVIGPKSNGAWQCDTCRVIGTY
jgi:hypothetical protein